MNAVASVLTAAMVAAATGGTVVRGAEDRAFEGFSIDSRTVQPGDLFFAIVAARDGHAFAGHAIAKGAYGTVVGPGFSPASLERRDRGDEPVVIQVADTTRALQDLGRFVRRESGATVVAITGSAGKTTTKEAIAALLSGSHRVIKNPGNLNNHLGLPLSLLELRHGADVAVMELGMNHAGEIRRLVEIAEPELRVWTNVGDAHIGFFASQDAIADAKAEILEHAAAGAVLVCNADDLRIRSRVNRFAGRIVTFGESSAADVRASAIADRGLAGTAARLHTPLGEIALTIPLIGRGNLANVLAAAAVAVEFQVPLAEIAIRVASLRAAAHRGEVLRLSRNLTIVDDSYNSSPSALSQALAVIASEKGALRRAAVLGEMLELGDHAMARHEAMGRQAAASRLDRLITVGGDAARAMADAAVAAGMDPDSVTWTATSEAATDRILPWLASGDVVLVKGSRGVGTDAVVARIRAEWR